LVGRERTELRIAVAERRITGGDAMLDSHTRPNDPAGGDSGPATPIRVMEMIPAAAGIRLQKMERTRGFEPRLLPWKGSVLQLHHVREARL
jgi:hypothetical protein